MFGKDYAPQMVQGKMAVWLQDIGWVAAKQGSNLKAGDELVYNYGYTAVITRVIKETAKTVLFEIKSTESDSVQEQRIGKDTWKAVAS